MTSTHTRGEGLHLALLGRGDQKLSAGEFDEAERLYLKCMNYMQWMPEPKLRMALCELLRGRPARAKAWLEPSLQFTLKAYRAIDPDPVEWAYYIVCLLCLGRLDRARLAAAEFEWLQHPELTGVRSAVAILDGRYPAPPVNSEESPRRCSDPPTADPQPGRVVAASLRDAASLRAGAIRSHADAGAGRSRYAAPAWAECGVQGCFARAGSLFLQGADSTIATPTVGTVGTPGSQSSCSRGACTESN